MKLLDSQEQHLYTALVLQRTERKQPAQSSLKSAMVEVYVEDNEPRLCLQGITGFGDSRLVFPFVFSCLSKSWLWISRDSGERGPVFAASLLEEWSANSVDRAKYLQDNDPNFF